MQVEIRHSPSFAIARLHLQPGETFKGESGVMATMSFGIEVTSQMQGGMMSALKRSALGGESFFVSTFRGHPEYASWIDVAPALPGDIMVFDIEPGRGLVMTRGTWLANEESVTIETKFGGSTMFFGGEGAFVLRASGQGKVVAGSYGAIDRVDLQAGQGFTVDSGHLVAYQEGMAVQTRKVSRGWMNTLKSGEGLVMDIQGPGAVWTQSRNPIGLVNFLAPYFPGQRA